MNLCEILTIDLKYYRKKYNLSQENLQKFQEPHFTIENSKVDVKSSTIDKFAKNINCYDKQSKIKFESLVTYAKEHITNSSRINKKKNQLKSNDN